MVFNVTKCSHGNYSVNIFFNATKFGNYSVNVTKCSHGNYSVNILFLMLQSVYMGIIPSIYGFCYKVFTWELYRQYMVFNVTKCSHGNYTVNILLLMFVMLQSF